MELSYIEKVVLKDALELLDRKEQKNYEFFECGSVERENCVRRMQAIKSIKEKLC